MRLNPPTCPVCGQIARGTVEIIPGLALLSFDESGEADYAGETQVHWDGQTTDRDNQGRVRLICSAGHDWPATMTDA